MHPGAVTDEIGIARAAFSGGPLGELVQWSDLISTLHILGHHLHLSSSISDLRVWVWTQQSLPLNNKSSKYRQNTFFTTMPSDVTLFMPVFIFQISRLVHYQVFHAMKTGWMIDSWATFTFGRMGENLLPGLACLLAITQSLVPNYVTSAW